MKCHKCDIEAKITKSGYVAVNDDTDAKETQIYIEQRFSCRNPNCSDFGKEIGFVRNPLKLLKDEP